LTDDQLVIRHVRLCECGSPAGHDSICKPGRLAAATKVDREWEDRNSGLRTLEHSKRQPDFRAERALARSLLTTRELAALADQRAAKLSTVSAGNIAPSHGGAQHPSVNLALQARSVDLASDPRWKAAEESERRTLNRKHELLDEYEGLGVARAERELSAEEKDAEIVAAHNEHFSAAEFARDHPGYGSASTVARKRRWFKGGYCTFSGLAPQFEDDGRCKCRCPTCRRAAA
jgi:hypothetical protein